MDSLNLNIVLAGLVIAIVGIFVIITTSVVMGAVFGGIGSVTISTGMTRERHRRYAG